MRSLSRSVVLQISICEKQIKGPVKKFVSIERQKEDQSRMNLQSKDGSAHLRRNEKKNSDRKRCWMKQSFKHKFRN